MEISYKCIHPGLIREICSLQMLHGANKKSTLIRTVVQFGPGSLLTQEFKSALEDISDYYYLCILVQETVEIFDKLLSFQGIY